MATITRGYNFAADELVTNFKLHRLVEGAVVTGLELSDTYGVEVGSNASLQTGRVRTTYSLLGTEVSTYSGTSSRAAYELYDAALGGYVELFNCDGAMQTRRFVGGADRSAWPIGCIAYPDANTGATLVLADKAFPAAYDLGVIGCVAPATISANGGSGIVQLHGFATPKCNSTGNAVWPMTCHAGDNVLNVVLWSVSNSSSLDGVYGVKLNNLSGAGNALQPFYFFGGPVTR